ncbi:hypothetical protein Ancab_033667 [Ancistrocladus abbreviatus]
MSTTELRPNEEDLSRFEMRPQEIGVKEEQRRSANYKPNIWSYDLIQSLTNEYNEALYELRVETLKNEIRPMFDQVTGVDKLEMIECINKLGLLGLFEKEINHALDDIECNMMTYDGFKEDIRAISLCFRLLRQHGRENSPDVFINFINENDNFRGSVSGNIEGVLKLFEVSHLALEGENILAMARAFSYRKLKDNIPDMDDHLAKQTSSTLELPLHWRVQWFEVREKIDAYAKEVNNNPLLLELARLNFNRIQAMHQKELKELSMWWRNLGLMQNVSFTRDRLVESFLWSIGVAYEPHYSCLRKCLAKVVTFVLVIDDLYDVYGSPEELECFTRAIVRWDSEEIQYLPDCMKTCFWALYDTTNEIGRDIEKENGHNGALPYLKKAWIDFCNALLMESRWYNNGYTPSIEEYLRFAWISSCGPLLSSTIFSFGREEVTGELINVRKEMENLVYHTSLIIRLCNDLGTSRAELERGDSPSSILCYMRDANVSEEIAREHIKNIIANTWMKINKEYIGQLPMLQVYAELVTNMARVCHFIYNNGDGFGIQDHDTKKLVKCLLIEHLRM